MKNVGKIDRIIRIILALVAVSLYYFDILTGTCGIVAIVLASIFVITSFISFCPLYAIFGINTCKIKK